MKGDKKVLEALSEALSEELTAINQYFLHAEMCEDMGYGKLFAAIKKESIDEMKHAELLIERILFLKGQPDMSRYLKINIGRKVPEMLKNDQKLEEGAVKMYNKAIKTAVAAGDNGTADLFKQLLADEELHYDWITEQIEMIEDIGIQNYLTLQVTA